MLWTYPTRYRDRHGEEVTAIQNDGQTLSMTVRGVRFAGRDFDDLAPLEGTKATELSSFTLQCDSLCSCEIECQIPMPVVVRGNNEEASLFVRLEFGNPNER